MGACFSATDDENAPHNRPRQSRSPATPTPENPEMKGVPLETKPKRLSDEEKALRDKALDKYKRQKARQDRRQERATRHAELRRAAEEAGEDPGELSDTCSSNMTVTTARTSTTLAPSTLVYGRGGYLDDDDEDERRSLGSHVSGRTASSVAKKRGHQPARTQEDMAERQRRKQRHKQYRRRHGAADDGQPGGRMDIFNQWASGSSQHSSGGSDADRDSHAPAHHNRQRRHTYDHNDDDEDTDYDDDRMSVASSLPRAPEDVLGVENMILPPSAHYQPHDAGAGKHKKKTASTDSPVTTKGHRAANLRVPGASSSTVSPSRSPPHTSVAAPTHGRKKWTGKQAEYNVAMSGFFATGNAASPVGMSSSPESFPKMGVDRTSHGAEPPPVVTGPPRASTQASHTAPREEGGQGTVALSASGANEVGDGGAASDAAPAAQHHDPVRLSEKEPVNMESVEA